MRCCGVHSPADWYRSPCRCIPESCCIAPYFEHCRKAIGDWNATSKDNLGSL